MLLLLRNKHKHKTTKQKMTNKTNENNEVAYKMRSALNLDGNATERLMLVLRTPPCEYNLCTMCGFDNNACKDIKLENIVNQFQSGIKGEDFSGIKRIDFPTAGSFYNDSELSAESRNYLFSEVSKLPVDSVMIETRVDYIDEDKINESKKHLRDNQRLELAIGLESANDRIRNKVLKKGLSKQGFERFADICKNTGSDLLAYTLIGSPTLTEAEAIEDAVETADFVYKIANEKGINYNVVEALKAYNGSQDISLLESLDCACKTKWESEVRK
jgi:radical SAM enzyme (TIGR01210 family)